MGIIYNYFCICLFIALVMTRKLGYEVNIDIKKIIKTNNLTEINYLKNQVFKHGLISIKNESILTDMELVQFGYLMGSLIPLPTAFESKPNSFVMHITNIFKNKTFESKFGTEWHNDGDFRLNNNVINILQSIIPTKKYGHTGFIDLNIGYKLLKNNNKTLFNQLINKSIAVDITEIKIMKESEFGHVFPVSHHKILNKHKTNDLDLIYYGHKKALIDGYTMKHSHEILNKVQKIITDKTVVYEYFWNKGDILIWDNTQVMHKAMGNFRNDKRLLQRLQVLLD